MREIEFRAWDTELKEYIDDYFELDFLHSKYCIEKAFYFYPKYILQQYIGLKDKNGTKIFEGDIIEYMNEIENGKGNVEFDSSCFHVAWFEQNTSKPSNFTTMNYLQCSSELEVIGNVFENKGLI